MPLAVAPEWQVKLLTDVLCHCIDKSRAASQLSEPRRRTVVEGLVRQHLQPEGPLDLNGMWGAMLHEPGVTERAMASAFAAMEDLEKVLPVPLQPTQRLQALNPVQRQALLGEAPIARTEIERMLRNARIEAQLAGARTPKIQTSIMPAIGGPPPAAPSGGGGQQVRLTAALMSIPIMKPSGVADTRPEDAPPITEPADEATKEARLRAARALLERAAVEIQLEAVKGRSTQSSLDPGRPRVTGVNEAIDDRSAPRFAAKSRPSVSTSLDAAVRSNGEPRRTDARAASGGKTGDKAAPGKAADKALKARQASTAAAILLLGLLISGGIAWALFHRAPLPPYDVSGLAPLRLSQGGAVSAGSVQATIDDPRWSGMSSDARRDAVLKVFKQLQGRGIHTLVLLGADLSVQAQVKDDLPGATAKDPLVLITGAKAGKK